MTIEDFLKEIGGKDAAEMVFRPGAVFTNNFGLTERYKFIDGKIEWGYPGIHRGVDRGGSHIKPKGKVNPIFCPVNCFASGYKDWKGRIYGTDVYFYHKAGFRVRISHMYPDDISILDKLMAGYPIQAGEFVGPIGSYGMSTGDHSHTEVESWGFGGEWLDTCLVLDQLLRLKFEDADKELTTDEVYAAYDMSSETHGWMMRQMDKDYIYLRKTKNVMFLNRHKMQFLSKGKPTTVYSSRSLFGM